MQRFGALDINLWVIKMKKKIRLIWQLYPSYLIIIFISLMAVSLYTSSFLETFFLDKTKKDLLIRCKLLKNQISQLVAPIDATRIDHLCKRIGKTSETRITVILPDGNVIGDTEENPSTMDNHRNRPEILAVLNGSLGSSIRSSETLHEEMMYAAIPLGAGNEIKAILRISLPITSINKTIKTVQTRVVRVGLFVVLLASVISLFVSRRISKPIEEMKQGAERFAEGDLGHRLHETNISEFSGLAYAMNQMAFQLEGRIATVKNQRNELESVLSSMSEGVIGIDKDENILNINLAALDILKVQMADVKGRSIQEVVRDPGFHKFIKNSITSKSPKEDDFMIHHLGNRIINTLSTLLRGGNDERIGTLIVLNDVTQIRNLETIRKDFVANVSHEIRTPLTAIKGFVETLIHIDDESEEDKKRFLGIIAKHVGRLDSILEGLLSLARIEQKDDHNGIVLEEINIKDVIKTALQIVQTKADTSRTDIELLVNDNIIVKIDPHLIEQALVNLIDNAIKYSPEKTTIRVSADIINSEPFISINDNGPGIHEKHLSRIFERFYRVDKARSRKLGGTGLGLSIVKHIASAHKGRVTVSSKLGSGSTFTFHFPEELLVRR